MFENEIKLNDLKSENIVYILFERDNPDYYVFLKLKKKLKKVYIKHIKN